jgi:hypothetical protein
VAQKDFHKVARSVVLNGGEPKSCLVRLFNSKLCRIVSIAWYVRIHKYATFRVENPSCQLKFVHERVSRVDSLLKQLSSMVRLNALPKNIGQVWVEAIAKGEHTSLLNFTIYKGKFL